MASPVLGRMRSCEVLGKGLADVHVRARSRRMRPPLISGGSPHAAGLADRTHSGLAKSSLPFCLIPQGINQKLFYLWLLWGHLIT